MRLQVDYKAHRIQHFGTEHNFVEYNIIVLQMKQQKSRPVKVEE